MRTSDTGPLSVVVVAVRGAEVMVVLAVVKEDEEEAEVEKSRRVEGSHLDAW